MDRPLVPSFSGVYVPEELVSRLREMIRRDTLPHALLLSGKPGSEALSLALATAKRILCSDPTPDGDSCGKCLSCRQAANLENPDLMVVFPLAKEGETKDVISAMQMPLFRKLVERYPRFTDHEWKEIQSSGNRQLSIMVAEAEYLIESTALKSFNSTHQVVVIWLPETMRTDTANKLLKLFEEPPLGVIFIAVTNSPETLLPTILSRFQRVRIPPIPEGELFHILTQDFGISEARALSEAHLSEGNLYRALKRTGYYGEKETKDRVLEEAMAVFECALSRDPRLYLQKAEALSKENRPFVIEVTERLFGILREALALNTQRGSEDRGEHSFVYIPSELVGRLEVISRQLPFGAFPTLMEDFSSAVSELRQNANIKILYFDLLIRIARLLIKQ